MTRPWRNLPNGRGRLHWALCLIWLALMLLALALVSGVVWSIIFFSRLFNDLP